MSTNNKKAQVKKGAGQPERESNDSLEGIAEILANHPLKNRVVSVLRQRVHAIRAAEKRQQEGLRDREQTGIQLERKQKSS